MGWGHKMTIFLTYFLTIFFLLLYANQKLYQTMHPEQTIGHSPEKGVRRCAALDASFSRLPCRSQIGPSVEAQVRLQDPCLKEKCIFSPLKSNIFRNGNL